MGHKFAFRAQHWSSLPPSLQHIATLRHSSVRSKNCFVSAAIYMKTISVLISFLCAAVCIVIIPLDIRQSTNIVTFKKKTEDTLI